MKKILVTFTLVVMLVSAVFLSGVSAQNSGTYKSGELSNVDGLPNKVEFGYFNSFDGDINLSQFDGMATGETNLSMESVGSYYEITSEGTTDPDSILYTVTAQTQLLLRMVNGSYTAIITGDQDFKVGRKATSSAMSRVIPSQTDGSTWRGYTQHSVAFANTLELAFTQETRTVPF